MRSFLFLVVLVVLVACTQKNTNPTPAGTTILSWDLTQSDREAMRSAKLGDVKVKDIDYTAMAADTPVNVKLHVETATVVFTEGGAERTHTSPTKMQITLADGKDFTFSGGRCMGPHYKLAAPGDAPRDMILHCTVKATKPSYDVSLTIFAYGDGTIDDGVVTTGKVR